jgi:NADH dehydrogenase [ubiquinone] 1 alpha subcomplex assembly factor 5
MDSPLLNPPLQSPGILFDRRLLRARRNRVAASYSSYAFLKERISLDLRNRLEHIRRPFNHALDLGCHTGQLSTHLKASTLISADLSEAMVTLTSSPLKVVLDEEALPFAPSSLDLIISALSVQWVNDIPGFLTQVFHCLKPDGLFLASLFGGDTLIELRECLENAELEISGGITPRLSPMLSIQDAGALLQRAGFALPVADHERIEVSYPHPLALLKDLRAMGETNALANRSRSPLTRKVLTRMVELYQKRYGLKSGRIYATFDIVTLTGWRPHESQPAPLKRGTAKTRLGDFV